MRNDSYSIIEKEKKEFYETFIHELNDNLQKMGLGWKVVLPDHISDGCVISLQGSSEKGPEIYPFVAYNRHTQLGEPLWLVVRNSLEFLLRDDRITKAAFKEMGVLSPNLVVPTLMNAKRNQEVLENFPHKLYGDGDLAIVLRIIYHSTDCLLEDMHLNLRVTSEMLNEFGMDFDTLYQWSLDNPENQRAVSVEPFGTEPEKKDIYIMTTESFYWGASAFLYKEKVHELSDKLGGDMVLFPTSINQCVALSNKNRDGRKWIQETLYDSKQSGFQQREKDLSDYIYVYSRKTDEIRKTSQRMRQKPKVNKNHSR